MLNELTNKLSLYEDLTYDEMSQAMDDILKGQVQTQETANFLRNLTDKGESDQELLAMLDKMQQYAIHITPKRNGKIITSVPALLSIHKAWYVITRPKSLRKFWLWTDQTFYTKKQLDKLAENEPVKIEITYHYPKYGNIIQILKKK